MTNVDVTRPTDHEIEISTNMLRRLPGQILLTLYVGVSLVNFFTEGWGYTAAAFVTVVLAMPLLIAVVLVERARRDRLTLLVIAALFLARRLVG